VTARCRATNKRTVCRVDHESDWRSVSVIVTGDLLCILNTQLALGQFSSLTEELDGSNQYDL